MSITAIVENDTIKLPPDVHLPDGTKVKIEPALETEAGWGAWMRATSNPERAALPMSRWIARHLPREKRPAW